MKEKTTTERYSSAIIAAMTIVNLRKQIKDQLAIIHSNLTCSELIGGEYNAEAVKQAFEISGVEIISDPYVDAECVYLNSKVSLHDKPYDLGRVAMNNVINESKAKNNLPS